VRVCSEEEVRAEAECEMLIVGGSADVETVRVREQSWITVRCEARQIDPVGFANGYSGNLGTFLCRAHEMASEETRRIISSTALFNMALFNMALFNRVGSAR
jgi:N-methylhydantoinase B/oxoprolinase/acetone carboxylase alpha subunit